MALWEIPRDLVLGTRWLRREALSCLKAVVRRETAEKCLALNFKQRQTMYIFAFFWAKS
jgi:hypothetical protein